MNKNNEKVNWLAGLLTGWGIRESWAKIIAGAIIGALAAAGLLTATGCQLSPSQMSDVRAYAKAGHFIFHRLTGQDCVFVLPVGEGKK